MNRSLCKTGIILSALERQKRRIDYYALDVSKGELTDGLHELLPLFRDSPYIHVQGLWGSYEDGIGWLARAARVASIPAPVVTFLWMGNSVANMTPADASLLLKGFVDACADFQLTCQFIVSLDNCTEVLRILDAYDTTRDPFGGFVLNGLKTANQILGQDVFVPGNWSCTRVMRHKQRTLDVYYEAVRDMECCYGGASWRIRQGDLVHAVHSGKWAREDLAEICRPVGLEVADVWQLDDKSYCKTLFDVALQWFADTESKLSLLCVLRRNVVIDFSFVLAVFPWSFRSVETAGLPDSSVLVCPCSFCNSYRIRFRAQLVLPKNTHFLSCRT